MASTLTNEINQQTDTQQNTKNSQIDNDKIKKYQSEISESNIYIKSLQNEIKKLQSKLSNIIEENLSEISNLKKDFYIKNLASQAGLIDMDCLPLLDTSKIITDKNGNISGAEDAMQDLQEKKPYLFKSQQNKSLYSNNNQSTPPVNNKFYSTSVKNMSDSEYTKSLKSVAPTYSRRYN